MTHIDRQTHSSFAPVTIRSRNMIFAAVTAWTLVLSGCDLPLPVPPTNTNGAVNLPVPFFIQPPLEPYCVPASVQMWRAYRYGFDPLYTQPAMFNWLLANYPYPETVGGIGGGTTVTAGAALARYALNDSSIQSVQYGYWQQHQYVADVGTSIADTDPSISIVADGRHAVIVRGASYGRRVEPLARLQGEWVSINDPLWGPGQNFSVGAFFMKESMGLAAQQRLGGGGQSITRHAFRGQISLANFDAQGGTYLGPGPDNPTGRYRYDGNGACYWEPSETGANACSGGGGVTLPTYTTLLSQATGQYVAAQGIQLTANNPAQTLTAQALGGGYYALRAPYNGYYVAAEGGGGGAVSVNRDSVAQWERFRAVSFGGNLVAFETYNGRYLVVGVNGVIDATATSPDVATRFAFAP